MRSAIPENDHLCQRQTLRKAENRGSFELGDVVRNGLLEASEGKEIRNKEEEDLASAPAVTEETTSVGSADRIGSQVKEPSKNVLVGSGSTISRGDQRQKRGANQE